MAWAPPGRAETGPRCASRGPSNDQSQPKTTQPVKTRTKPEPRGQLILRPVTPLPALARGLPLHPDDPGDPYVFRIDLSRFGIGTSRVVFSRSPHAGVTAFHLDLDVAPLSFDKQPATRDPRYWVTSALGTVAAGTTANVVRRHRQYAPLRARGRALAAAAAATPAPRRHDLPHQRTQA